MRAGVNDFCGGAVRQVDVRAFIAESELQHGHTGNLQSFAQGVNFGSDVAEIFREKRQATERLAKFLEQVVTRAIHPAAVDGGGIGCRNFPELVEAAEMIEPHVIAISRRPAQALDPPGIASGLHRVPAVKRIAPALPGLAEKIWGDAGDGL